MKRILGIAKFIRRSFRKALRDEPLTIRDVAVEALSDLVEDYSDWYETQGLYLPPDYAADPGEWNEALHKMKRAFRLLHEELHEEGELWQAKHGWAKYGEKDTQKIEELEADIKEGLTIFGKQLLYLNDPKKGVEQGH